MLFFLKDTVDYHMEKSELIELGKDIQQVEKIVECLARSNHTDDCNDLIYPNKLGKMGRLGESVAGHILNAEQYNSLIYKTHLALTKDDFNSNSWKRKTNELRTSDNYVLYVKHPEVEDCILVLGIVSPDAHKRIEDDTTLVKKLIAEASYFQDLDEREFSKCGKYFIEN